MLDFQKTVDGYFVSFAGEFTIFDAQSVFEELKPAILEKQNVTFDLANITSIDTSVMQSFMFIKSYLKQHACELHLMNHSSAVLSLMERLGLVYWFNDPVLLSSDEPQANRKSQGDK